jgi:hypothetical protein
MVSPVAAKIGTGRQMPRTMSKRSQREARGAGEARCREAAVMPLRREIPSQP